jgi:hypothetical protein
MLCLNAHQNHRQGHFRGGNRLRAGATLFYFLFYFGPSYNGPSILAPILAKRLILPMKIVIGV